MTVEKRTPGIRRALRALAAAKKRNKKRLAAGKRPVLEGHEVSLDEFRSRTSYGKRETVAKIMEEWESHGIATMEVRPYGPDR